MGEREREREREIIIFSRGRPRVKVRTHARTYAAGSEHAAAAGTRVDDANYKAVRACFCGDLSSIYYFMLYTCINYYICVHRNLRI